jgi:hypothetical protein
MTFEGTLERSVLGGVPTLTLRTSAGMTYELVKAPAKATSLVGKAVSVHGELEPEQFGFAMTGPRVRVSKISKG